MKHKLRIIVTGLIAQHYTLPGVTWDYIQYAVGLKQLGHEVYYFEDSGEWPYNLDGGPSGNDWVAKDCKPNIQHLERILSKYGLGDRWAYFFPTKSEWYGLSDLMRKEVIQTADLLINVSGTLEYPENYSSVKRLAYIDSDPGFTQVKLLNKDKEFSDRIGAHDVHFSFGEQLPDYLRQSPYHWNPTRSPILISEWRTTAETRPVFSTIMNWTSYKPLQLGDQIYGQKDVEFVKFLDLPRFIDGVDLEMAISKTQHKNWQSKVKSTFKDDNQEAMSLAFDTPQQLLRHYGWKVVDPAVVCKSVDDYQRYIETSFGEWSVAKGGYVTAQAAWFSCRSACYLAAGRPVVVQHTGFDAVLPVGRGLLAFDSQEEAIEGIQEVQANYAVHRRAARDLAEAYLASEKILLQLIETAFTEQYQTLH